MLIRHRLPPCCAALVAVLAVAVAGPVAAQGPKGLTEFTLPQKAVAKAYGQNPGLTCPDYGVAGTVIDSLARDAREAGRTSPPTDGRLCALANVLLGWKSDEVPPSDALLFLMRGVGFLSPPQQVLLATVETEDPRDIARGLASSLLDASAKGTAPRYGLATKRLARNSTRVVMLLLDAPYDLAPLPRQLPPGGTATLSGTLLGGYEKPELVVSDALGKLSEPPQAPGKAFSAQLRCGDRPGRIQVELRATLDGQLRKLAGIPVACGGAPLPTTLSLEEQPWPADPAAQAKLIFDGINAERTAAGLAPLAWEPALAGVAQDLTVDLAREQLGGAGSGVKVTDRLAKVEMGSPLVLQNPGMSTSARRAAEGSLENPIHRANLMNPDVNAGGVGVVIQPGPDGKPLAFINELFIQVLPALDPVKVRADVQAGLMQRRAEAKVTPVTPDPVLEQVAQAYAEALAAGGGELGEAKAEALTSGVARKYKEINLVAGAKPDPMAFAADASLLGKSGKGLGVGAARGKHPVIGKNAVFVVVITATKR